MDKLKQTCRQHLKDGGRLLCSPFVGAWQEMAAEVARPRAANCKTFVLNSMRAYFAPATGAVRGFTRTCREIYKETT
jgi:hypothetical protein